MCSPRVFPITPDFKPIYFAQNPPLLTYIPRVFVATNLLEEKNFIKPMGSAISSHGALVFFLLVLGVRLGGWRLEKRFFFFKLYLVWRVHYSMSTWTLDTGLSM
jgi:hypothetical protein